MVSVQEEPMPSQPALDEDALRVVRDHEALKSSREARREHVAKLVEEDPNDSSDESSDESSDDSSDGSDEESDSDEEEVGFEYPDVIDGASKIGKAENAYDEDIGGQAVDSVSVLAAGVAGTALVGRKSSLVLGLCASGIVAYVIYLLWIKIGELRKEVARLEKQQDMGLNDKDVKVITTQVLEDFLKHGECSGEPMEHMVVEPEIDELSTIPEEGSVDEHVYSDTKKPVSVCSPMAPLEEPVPEEVSDEVVEKVEEEVVDKVEEPKKKGRSRKKSID